jgi:hypothetical protein
VDFFDTQLTGDGTGSGEAVSGRHDHPHAIGLQAFDSEPGGGFDRVGDGEQPREHAIHGQVHDAGSVAAQLLGLRLQGFQGDAGFCHQGGVAQLNTVPVDLAAHADP